MTKEWMIQKLTSRKFWVAIAGIVTGIAMIVGADDNTSQLMGGVAIDIGSIVAYLLGESWADSKRVGGSDV